MLAAMLASTADGGGGERCGRRLAVEEMAEVQRGQQIAGAVRGRIAPAAT